MLNITEEEIRRKYSTCSIEDDLSEERVEQWLDKHEDFVVSYFTRKANRVIRGSLARPRTRTSSNASTPTGQATCGSQTEFFKGHLPLTPDGTMAFNRKVSSSDFDKGYLKPIISHVDGIPSFLNYERRLSAPSRQRKSNEELKELKILDEQALLIDLVHDIANDLDITSLCHKILQNVSILTNGDRCSIFLVQKYTEGHRILVSKVHDVNADSTVADVSANEEIEVPWGKGIVGYVAQTGETVNIADAYADPRFNRQVDKDTGYRTNTLLCMPIKSAPDEDGNIEIIGVAQVLNKSGVESSNEHTFTEDDEKIFQKYLTFCGIGIANAQLFEQFQLELKRNQVLLDQARVIFEEQSTLHDVVHKIMKNTQSLILCERCSVLLVDPTSKELFSRAFHLEARDCVDEEGSVELTQSLGTADVKFPVNIGIIGYVATTGETLNIANAYEDPRFDPSVDGGSGFKTNSILCMPIRNGKGEIIGVVQLLNKMDGKPFNFNDQSLFEAFAIFCGMAINNTSIYEECVKARARQKIAFDVLSYHATASASDSLQLMKETLPTARTFRLREFSFDDNSLTDQETVMATLRMFSDLQLINRFRVDYQTLCSWVLTVKKNYRSVTYHNWRHAFNVTQCMFLMLKKNPDFKHNFSDEEKFAMILACLCHDLDHRGQNNIFQVKSSSPLAQLYGTSVMEHHHFDHCIMILHSSGNEILNTLSPEEYNVVINLLEHAILSTDMALYFKKRNEYFDVVETKSFQWEQNNHRSLLRSMLMTACDLSAICKPWDVQKRVALLVAEEFFQQGDLEQKQLNVTPIEMMDRAKKDKFPVMQVGYIDHICLPIYQHLSDHYDELKPLVEYCIENKRHWKVLADDHIRRTSSIAAPQVTITKPNGDDEDGERISVFEEVDEKEDCDIKDTHPE